MMEGLRVLEVTTVVVVITGFKGRTGFMMGCSSGCIM